MTASAAAPADRLAAAYETKADSYFSQARGDFVERLPRDASARILEIGCGTGATGSLALARGRCGYIAGVELLPSAAHAAERVLSEVVCGDVETMQLPWPAASFDALILSEVLEHLVEPWRVLAEAARLIRPGGMVLASSPNVSHWRVVASLARGRFELADRGVFDRTHMRWFTPATFGAMFDAAGFAVDAIGPVTPFSARTRLASLVTRGRFDHLFITQICLAGHRR